MTVSQKLTQDGRRPSIGATASRSIGDGHASNALPPTLFELRNLYPSQPQSTCKSGDSACQTPAALSSHPTVIAPTEAGNPRPAPQSAERVSRADETAIQAATRQPMAPPQPTATPSQPSSFTVVHDDERDDAANTLNQDQPKRNWRELLRANALVIAMLLLVIFFALKVSRRASESSTEPAVADSVTTELTSPEALVVFADADLKKTQTDKRDPSPSGTTAPEASVALMSPKSVTKTKPGMPSVASLDQPTDLELPALSGGTQANTVSSMMATGPGQIAAANASGTQASTPQTAISSYAAGKPTPTNQELTGLDASGAEPPELPPTKAPLDSSSDSTTSDHQESDTPRGILNWEKYLPSAPEVK
ncbi:hypothetical protein Pla52o_04270 [Novipirellula galeiformis]|uniref:Uncharacterized protein n=1 Tax=Novipirellula galeiformis TaxID=2528004 RepID=A0A5C6CSN4_9BACT|nr:hypothetical protein [Novipirellula galeiformis]TWU26574.1 hypothetical protein Pla52o_04270 [Novipirellula galeiformis]